MGDTIRPTAEWINPVDTELQFQHEVLVFENATDGDQIEAIYEFANTGKQALTIEIVSACACMEVDWTRTPIGPGEHGMVKVVFDTTGRTGDLSKDIDVIFKNTDSEGYPLVKRLKLMGHVFRRI